jgi:polyhydroxyalkanoate synthesis regulator phasin
MDFESRINSLIQEKTVKKAEILDLISLKNKEKLDELAKKGKITKEELKRMIINKPPIKEALKEVDSLVKLAELKNILTNIKLKVNKLFIFKLIIFVCFIFSFVMTVYYNYLGFLQVKANSFEAFGCSLALVLFGITCIEAIIFLWANEENKGIKLSSIIIKVCITVFLSMMALLIFVINFQNIMVGQFEKYQDVLTNKEISWNNNSLDLNESYKKEEAEQERQLIFAEQERDRLLVLQSNYVEKTRDYNLLQRRIVDVTKSVNRYSASLTLIRSQQRELLTSNKLITAKQMTYYTYLNEKIFKGHFNAGLIEFFQLVAPALIFDLLASISLALLFFLRKEKEFVNNV